MPLFYFHLSCDDQYIPDLEGCEHADLEAARTEALAGARCMLSTDVKDGRLNLNQRFELHDADGHFLLAIPFSEAVEITQPGIAARSVATRLSSGARM